MMIHVLRSIPICDVSFNIVLTVGQTEGSLGIGADALTLEDIRTQEAANLYSK